MHSRGTIPSGTVGGLLGKKQFQPSCQLPARAMRKERILKFARFRMEEPAEVRRPVAPLNLGI